MFLEGETAGREGFLTWSEEIGGSKRCRSPGGVYVGGTNV